MYLDYETYTLNPLEPFWEIKLKILKKKLILFLSGGIGIMLICFDILTYIEVFNCKSLYASHVQHSLETWEYLEINKLWQSFVKFWEVQINMNITC